MSFKNAEKIFKRLHSKAIRTFKGLDEIVKVSRTNWKYKEKGGGQSVELSNGKIIDLEIRDLNIYNVLIRGGKPHPPAIEE